MALAPAALVTSLIGLVVVDRPSRALTAEYASLAALGLIWTLASACIQVKVPASERPRALVALWSVASAFALVGQLADQWPWLLLWCLLSAIVSEFSLRRQLLLCLIACGAWLAIELEQPAADVAIVAATCAGAVALGRGGPGFRAWMWIAALPLAAAVLDGVDRGNAPLCTRPGDFCDPVQEFNRVEWWRYHEFARAFRASGALLIGGLLARSVLRHGWPRLTRPRMPSHWFRDVLPAPTLLGVFTLANCNQDAAAAVAAASSVRLAPPALVPTIAAALDTPFYQAWDWPALVVQHASDPTSGIGIATRTWHAPRVAATAKDAARSARTQILQRSAEPLPPSGVALIAAPETRMPSILHIFEELRSEGVDRVGLAYFSPRTEPLAPTLDALQPRLRYKTMFLLSHDELDCNAPTVPNIRVAPRRSSQHNPWLNPYGTSPVAWLAITPGSSTNYGDLLAKVIAADETGPAHTVLVFVPPDWRLPCAEP